MTSEEPVDPPANATGELGADLVADSPLAPVPLRPDVGHRLTVPRSASGGVAAFVFEATDAVIEVDETFGYGEFVFEHMPMDGTSTDVWAASLFLERNGTLHRLATDFGGQRTVRTIEPVFETWTSFDEGRIDTRVAHDELRAGQRLVLLLGAAGEPGNATFLFHPLAEDPGTSYDRPDNSTALLERVKRWTAVPAWGSDAEAGLHVAMYREQFYALFPIPSVSWIGRPETGHGLAEEPGPGGLREFHATSTAPFEGGWGYAATTLRGDVSVAEWSATGKLPRGEVDEGGVALDTPVPLTSLATWMLIGYPLLVASGQGTGGTALTATIDGISTGTFTSISFVVIAFGRSAGDWIGAEAAPERLAIDGLL